MNVNGAVRSVTGAKRAVVSSALGAGPVGFCVYTISKYFGRC